MNAPRWCRCLIPLLAGLALASTAAFADGTSPISFHLGGAEFTPGGYLDMCAVYRSTNTGAALASSFGAIPYDNTVQGNLSELRMTAQQSRLNLRVADDFDGTKVGAYAEIDWAGNAAANLWVDSNSQTLRMRQFWASVSRGHWDVLAGQAWSWVTPNRKGLSSNPSELMVTRNLDGFTNVGVAWTRGAQFRVAYHSSDAFAFGLAAENPDQYVGAGEVIYPFAFNAQLGPQFDAANQTTVPNYRPDFLAKAAWDGSSGAGPIHLEAVALVRTFRATVVPIGATAFAPHMTQGTGYGGAATIALLKKLRVTASGLRGDGIGRYLNGLGPDVVVQPVGVSPNFDVDLSTVSANTYLLGLESELTPQDMVCAYFGRTDFEKNSFPDVTSPLVVKPIIGFGGANSPNSANQTLRELTVDASHAFWKSAEHGSLQIMAQFSEITRRPFYVAAGAPNKALVDMGYLSLRYTLP